MDSQGPSLTFSRQIKEWLGWMTTSSWLLVIIRKLVSRCSMIRGPSPKILIKTVTSLEVAGRASYLLYLEITDLKVKIQIKPISKTSSARPPITCRSIDLYLQGRILMQFHLRVASTTLNPSSNQCLTSSRRPIASCNLECRRRSSFREATRTWSQPQTWKHSLTSIWLRSKLSTSSDKARTRW